MDIADDRLARHICRLLTIRKQFFVSEEELYQLLSNERPEALTRALEVARHFLWISGRGLLALTDRGKSVR